jgi:hypothetical protein
LHHGHRTPLAAFCISVFFDALFLPDGGGSAFLSFTAAVGGSASIQPHLWVPTSTEEHTLAMASASPKSSQSESDSEPFAQNFPGALAALVAGADHFFGLASDEISFIDAKKLSRSLARSRSVRHRRSKTAWVTGNSFIIVEKIEFPSLENWRR